MKIKDILNKKSSVMDEVGYIAEFSTVDVNKEETTSKLIEFDTNLVKRLLGVEIKNSDINRNHS